MTTAQEARKESQDIGFKELKDTMSLIEALGRPDFLLFINSTCSNSAIARMILRDVIKIIKLPRNSYTLLAGQDIDATSKAREILRIKPSSPAFYIVKKNRVIYTIDRDAIILQDRHVVVKKLSDAILHAFH